MSSHDEDIEFLEFQHQQEELDEILSIFGVQIFHGVVRQSVDKVARSGFDVESENSPIAQSYHDLKLKALNFSYLIPFCLFAALLRCTYFTIHAVTSSHIIACSIVDG